MFVSKFWTLLLALVIGVMLAVILLGKDVVNREREENATSILYKELSKTDVALKLHARKRLDVLMTISVDPQVRKLLYTASLGRDKAQKIRDPLLATLRKRNADLDQFTADLLIALDTNGKVICQVGKNERQHGHDLSGFPAVDAALRGYLRDDIWKIGNDVFLIATRPVIEQGRYVGAVVHAMKITDKLASDISPSMQLAFFAGNMPIAVGKSNGNSGGDAQGALIAKALDDVLKSAKFRKDGYSEVKRIASPEKEYLAVYSKVRGEAAQNDVIFALVSSVTFMASPTEIYENAGTQDVKALPLVWIIIGVILVFALGWVWNYFEGERPLSTLLASINALKSADPKDQLNVYKFRRKIRKTASAMNELVDYKIRSLLDSSDSAGKSIDSILSKQGSGTTATGARMSSASFKFVEPGADSVPPPPPAEHGDVGKGQKQQKPVSAPQAPIAAQPAAPAPAPAPLGKQPAKGAPSKANSAPQDEQIHFREIYEQFVALKNKLGEQTAQLTFDRFLGTLKKNRDTLISRYGCKQVKFQVYEKNGKASLRATPVKD